MDRTALARAYYRAIDGDDYDLLADLLAESFVHDRPERTIEGRERFVRFMREQRPQTDTTHPIATVYTADSGVVVEGRLLDSAGEEITRFVDVFRFDEERIGAIRTYTTGV